MKKFPILELKFIEGESLQLVVSLLIHYSIKITTGEILAFFHIYSVFRHECGGNLVSPLRTVQRIGCCGGNDIYCHTFLDENAITGSI